MLKALKLTSKKFTNPVVNKRKIPCIKMLILKKQAHTCSKATSGVFWDTSSVFSKKKKAQVKSTAFQQQKAGEEIHSTSHTSSLLSTDVQCDQDNPWCAS